MGWDSNVITPGTDFMLNLSILIKYYICHKMTSCPLWKNLKVVFSDSNEVGEGEHKIMNFIRCFYKSEIIDHFRSF